MIDWGTILRKAMLAFIVVGFGALVGALVVAALLPPAEPVSPLGLARLWLGASSAAATGAALREFLKQVGGVE